MKYKRTRVLIIFLIGLVIIGCATASNVNIPSQNDLNGEAQGFQNPTYYGNYNLIYGDWKVSGYIAEGKHCDEELLKSYIGIQILYRYNEIVISNTRYSVKQYIPYVIAMEDRMLFIGSDYYPSDESIIFDTDSAYFVSFSPTIDGESDSNLVMSQIIVKDNNTLILKAHAGYCILSRTAFLNNLDILIAPV